MLAGLLLAGCRTSRKQADDLPPSLAWPSDTITPENAAECWAALEWAMHDRTYLAERDTLRRQQIQAGNILYASWAAEIAGRFESVLIEEGSLQTSHTPGDAECLQVLTTLQAGLTVRPSWVRLARLPGLRPIPEALEKFLRENAKLRIPVCHYGDCVPALHTVQEQILNTLISDTEARMANGEMQQALGQFFRQLGVAPAKQEHRERVAELGNEWITLTLETFRNDHVKPALSQAALDSAIAQFHDLVRDWEEDERLRDALSMAKPEIDHLQAQLFEQQTDLWYRELRLATENGRFSGVYDRLDEILSADVGSDRQAKRRQRAMWTAYWAFLIRAHQIWLQTAEDELASGQFGTVLTLCRTLTQFVGLAESLDHRLPPGLDAQVERRDHLQETALRMQRRMLERRIILRDMKSISGADHGEQFSRGVRRALEKRVSVDPLLTGVTVANVDESPYERDYTLIQGRIEEFAVEVGEQRDATVTIVGQVVARCEVVQYKQRSQLKMDQFFERTVTGEVPGPAALLEWLQDAAVAEFASRIALLASKHSELIDAQARKAEKDGNWRQAAHLWGVCAQQLSQLDDAQIEAARAAGLDLARLRERALAQALSAATRAISGTR